MGQGLRRWCWAWPAPAVSQQYQQELRHAPALCQGDGPAVAIQLTGHFRFHRPYQGEPLSRGRGGLAGKRALAQPGGTARARRGDADLHAGARCRQLCHRHPP